MKIVMEDCLTEKIQEAAKEILKAFHDVCEKNQIKYSMAYGTLLGSVRHKGFIPWDDDIDVFMVRSEYERFRAVFNDERYELLDWDIDEKYPYLFPKIRKKDTVLIENNISDINYNIGVYIDIFILDEAPTGVRACFKKVEFTVKYKLYRLSVLNDSQLNSAFRLAAKPLKRGTLYHKLAKKCSDVYKKEKGCFLRDASMPDKSMYLKKEEMDRLSLVAFGEESFWGSDNYDEILTRFYGKYMELPEEEDRVSNHSFYKIEL